MNKKFFPSFDSFDLSNGFSELPRSKLGGIKNSKLKT